MREGLKKSKHHKISWKYLLVIFQQPIEKHYAKKDVHAVEVLPLLPDFEMWQHACAQVNFKGSGLANPYALSRLFLIQIQHPVVQNLLKANHMILCRKQ